MFHLHMENPLFAGAEALYELPVRVIRGAGGHPSALGTYEPAGVGLVLRHVHGLGHESRQQEQSVGYQAERNDAHCHQQHEQADRDGYQTHYDDHHGPVFHGHDACAQHREPRFAQFEDLVSDHLAKACERHGVVSDLGHAQIGLVGVPQADEDDGPEGAYDHRDLDVEVLVVPEKEEYGSSHYHRHCVTGVPYHGVQGLHGGRVRHARLFVLVYARAGFDEIAGGVAHFVGQI